MTKKKTTPREKQARPSSCVGCGEAASGYNYDAPSCNSCKTFFRRTVMSKKVFKGCLMGGICEQDESARQCRACRYDKCIKGGMNPLLIINSNSEPSTSTGDSSDASTTVVECSNNGFRRHEAAPRLTRSSSSSSGGSPGSTDGGSSSPDLRLLFNPSRVENKVDKMIINLLSIEEAHQRLRVSSYTPRLSNDLTVESFVHGPSKLGENYPVMCVMPKEPKSYELYPVEDVVYSVHFIKALPIYNLLDDKSKLVLISSALTCSNFTAAFYSYINKSDRTFYPDGCVMTWDNETLKNAPHSTRYHSAIIGAMKEADIDAREYALLKMIIICNPMLEGLTVHGATLLSQEKEGCSKALFSYVLARRGVEQGPSFFIKLIAVINVLIELTSAEKNQHITAIAMNLYEVPTPFGESIFRSV